MFYENKTKTGGFAAKAGTGTRPGTLDAEFRVKDAFKTYWINTRPPSLFNNKLSVDLCLVLARPLIMGIVVNMQHGHSTYSGRVAWYPAGPKASIVGEVFGSAGEAGTLPSIRSGCVGNPASMRFLR